MARPISERHPRAVRGRSVPAEPAGFEALPGGRGEDGFGPEHGWGHRPVVGWADVVAPVIAEAQPVGLFRIARDLEGALVMQAVVEPAQAAEVRGHGEAAVFTVHEVVDLHPALLGTTRVATALVTLLDDPAQPGVHGLLQRADAQDGAVVVFDHGADLGVTAQEPAQRIRQLGTEVDPGPPVAVARGGP